MDVSNLPKLFSPANSMYPIPPSLQPLLTRQVARLLRNLRTNRILGKLLSPVISMVSVYKLKGGQRGFKNHVISFDHDLKSFARSLPRKVKDLQVVVFRKEEYKGSHRNFYIKREEVLLLARFLQAHNSHWKRLGINIDEDNIAALPEDGTILPDLPIYSAQELEETTDDLGPSGDVNEDHEAVEYNSAVFFTRDEDLEQCKIKKLLKIPVEPIPFPALSPVPLNDLAVDGILSMCFVGLFPFGNHGDPTSKTRIRTVSETMGFKHLLWHSATDPDGEVYYPFAEHPEFAHWAYSRLQRSRVMGQSSVYLKQSDTDRALTMCDLKEMLE